VNSVEGSGTWAEITNVSLSGAHSDFPDVILSGFSFVKGTKNGSAAKATALTVAVKDRTGELDTNVNGTGELINPNYGEAVFGRVRRTRDGSNGGTDGSPTPSATTSPTPAWPTPYSSPACTTGSCAPAWPASPTSTCPTPSPRGLATATRA
jgi:hypothetical protein